MVSFLGIALKFFFALLGQMTPKGKVLLVGVGITVADVDGGTLLFSSTNFCSAKDLACAQNHGRIQKTFCFWGRVVNQGLE